MEANLCEACGAEGGYKYHISITSPKTEIIINLCKRHYKFAIDGIVSASELIYVHNNYVIGNHKQFLK